MLLICEEFAFGHNIQFSTNPDPVKSKSKAVYCVGRNTGVDKPVPLMLGGRALPWVPRAEHLGHTLHEDGTMSHDTREKRAQFIDSSVKMMDTFEFAHSEQIISAIEKSSSSFYGSNLWDLSG